MLVAFACFVAATGCGGGGGKGGSATVVVVNPTPQPTATVAVPTPKPTETTAPTPTATAVVNASEPGCLFAAAVGPFGIGQSDKDVLSAEQVHRYVDLAKPDAKGIRFFGATNGIENGYCYAKSQGFDPVIAGVFVNSDPVTVADQLDGLQQVIGCVDYVVVGSNAITEQNVLIDTLLDYACQAKHIALRAGSDALVTIGERWDVYLTFQTQIKQARVDGVRCIDVAFPYRHPFYDSDRPDVASAVDRVASALADVDGAFDIPVFIGETGWPGAPDEDILAQKLDARATLDNQREFWQRVLNRPSLKNKVVGYQINDEEWLCGFESHLCKFGFYYSNLSSKWQVQEAFKGNCTN